MGAIIHYIADQEKATDQPLRMYHNTPSMDLDAVTQAFTNNLQFQTPQNRLTAYHDILSFHPHDQLRLSRDMIHDLVQHYIKLRAPQSLWFGQLHTDQNHPHFHLLLSGNEYHSRRASRMSRPAFYQLRVDMERYQQEQFPALRFSQHYHKMRDYPIHLLYSRLAPIYEQASSKADFWTDAQKALENKALIDPVHQAIMYLNRRYTLADIGIDLSIFDRMEQLERIRASSRELSKKREPHRAFNRSR